jgi:hypothetical protein
VTVDAPSTLVRTAQTMAIDRLTAEVVTAFESDGIGSVLLKGPSIAAWLYPEGGRFYGDSDVLVDPAQFAEASHALVTMGFEKTVRGQAEHAHTYRRTGPSGWYEYVDLHRTIPLAAASPSDVWKALRTGAETQRVGGSDVAVLGIPQRILHIALHAVQHAFETKGPYEDLRRAVAMVDQASWQQAVMISRRIGAEDALAAGLCLIPEGASIAQGLDLTDARRGIVRIATSPQSQGAAYHLQRFLDAPTLGERVKLIVDPLFPSPAVLRQGSELARRGRTGLVVAYLGRPVTLARRLGPALTLRRHILKPHG